MTLIHHDFSGDLTSVVMTARRSTMTLASQFCSCSGISREGKWCDWSNLKRWDCVSILQSKFLQYVYTYLISFTSGLSKIGKQPRPTCQRKLIPHLQLSSTRNTDCCRNYKGRRHPALGWGNEASKIYFTLLSFPTLPFLPALRRYGQSRCHSKRLGSWDCFPSNSQWKANIWNFLFGSAVRKIEQSN